MKIDNTNNNINFGWNAFTHKAITKKALKEIPSLNKYKRILQNYSMAPDFDCTRYIGDTHCYYKTKNYVDIDLRVDAKSFYTEYIKRARVASMNGSKVKTAQFIGRALHFLQDMANPMHTTQKPVSILEKAADERMHRKFETVTFFHQKSYCNNYKKTPISDKRFSQLFMDNVDYSTSGKQVSKNNTYSWEDIAQDGINQAISSTTLFLQKMAHLLE